MTTTSADTVSDTASVTGSTPPAYRGAAAAAPAGVRGGAWSADVGARRAEGVSEGPGEDVGEVVLFLIGMRVNRLRKVRQWSWVARQMPRMLSDLSRLPDSPLLQHQTWWSGRDIMVSQVWRSAEELGRFARDQDHPHATAWRVFNTRIAASADVGIWHETYVVRADQVESLYGNTAPIGLGAAFGLVPAGARRATSAVRRVHGAAGDHPIGEID